jgi:hypothetical protein
MALALTAVGATAVAGDRDDYRRHDRGNKHYQQYDRHAPPGHYSKHYRQPPRHVHYVPARPVYYRPPPRVYYPAPGYYPAAQAYYPVPVHAYGGQPSLGIQLYIPLK